MVKAFLHFAWQLEVFYSNGTVYSVLTDYLSSNPTITKEAVIQAGELTITFTFYVASGYLWINSTKLLPAPCSNTSGDTRRDQGVLKGRCQLKHELPLQEFTSASARNTIYATVVNGRDAYGDP